MTPSSLLITELYLFSVSVWLVIEVQIGWSYGGVDNSMTSLSLPIITDSLNLTPEVPTAHVALTHQYSNPGKLSRNFRFRVHRKHTDIRLNRSIIPPGRYQTSGLNTVFK